ARDREPRRRRVPAAGPQLLPIVRQKLIHRTRRREYHLDAGRAPARAAHGAADEPAAGREQHGQRQALGQLARQELDGVYHPRDGQQRRAEQALGKLTQGRLLARRGDLRCCDPAAVGGRQRDDERQEPRCGAGWAAPSSANHASLYHSPAVACRQRGDAIAPDQNSRERIGAEALQVWCTARLAGRPAGRKGGVPLSASGGNPTANVGATIAVWRPRAVREPPLPDAGRLTSTKTTVPKRDGNLAAPGVVLRADPAGEGWVLEEDSELVERASRGDVRAYEGLVERYREVVFR